MADNEFHYLKIEAKEQAPVRGRHLVFLGDQTAKEHVCFLQQLADKGNSVGGFVISTSSYQL